MQHTFGIEFFGALFAIMNPFANLPIFLSLTEGMEVARQRRIALRVLVYCAAMCAVVAVAGQQILNFFDVSIDAFRVAGGVVLAGIAMNLLGGEHGPQHHGSDSEKQEQKDLGGQDVAFYPLTFPILVGPGSITTLIVFLHQALSPANYISFTLAVALVLVLLTVTFWFSASLDARLSLTMRAMMTRIMGMILLAIAIGMLAEGASNLLPGLAGPATHPTASAPASAG